MLHIQRLDSVYLHMNWMELATTTINSDPIIGYAVPFFAVFVLIEMALIYMDKDRHYNQKNAWASIAMGVGSVFVNLLVKTVAVLCFSWIYNNYALFPNLHTYWWAWIILFFADDFTFYVHHRMCHEVRLFWAGHVNHHSCVDINLAIALRQSWGELFHKYIWWLWLPLIGFPPIMILAAMSINLIFQFFQHTELVGKLGPLEWIFNTPSHHRVHHASNVRYLDRNHAGVLIIWDRLFGTFQEEQKEIEAPVYGITTNIDTHNPLKIASHEYIALWRDVKRTKGIKNKLKYIFMPPGWSPDGSTLTADQMRKEAGLSS